ncbi:sigma-54-dependent Fis family transcriptional regulator [Trinickia diaoshuihuensis]|uniref:sigma-54-dependent Fis family transcriptional regulator n=1 Tax=Trinickia diaoshuihuensis TaxID=2292265 RepID=UPI000E227A07|nr:sigma-54-dependent Fis family transcriptional regulator [Trinickia diaoshuihuensis]
MAVPNDEMETGGRMRRVRSAHERSRRFGLQSFTRPDYDLVSEAELARKLEENRIWTAQALPLVETLHKQIADSQSIVVLADAQGLVLHSTGDDGFLARAEKVALRPGANWAESHQGTNAIGTALVERSAGTICGDQHYLAAHRFMTCSSAPIFDAYGAIVGVLDVTGDCRGYHRHTLALVEMSVRMIEERLFADAFRDRLQVAFHPRPESLGTLHEGIAAFTFDGTFLSANRNARSLLNLSLDAPHTHTLSSLLGVTLGQLLDKTRAGVEGRVRLTPRNGGVVFARISSPRNATAANEQQAARPPAFVASTGAVLPAGGTANAPRLSDLDTGDARMSMVIAKVRRVIGKNIPVLITGETGTGKELLAQALHNESPRRHAPFVAVNCASIPETLIESELFGYEEGAFTGARRKGSAGKLIQANGGTLFLDEIGDMPYPLQMRLLRVLQERVVNPLGSAKSVSVDIAVVCATHRGLREMIDRNLFRQDLYYRLNGLVVKLPPLRERTDLAVIVERVLENESLAGDRGQRLSLSPDVMQLFEQCSWPGNVRQLDNLLRTAAVMVDPDGLIRRHHLPDDFFEDLAARHSTSIHGPEPAQSGSKLQEVAVSTIAAALALHDGNVSAAARALGVSRTTIYRKLPRPEARQPLEPDDDR